MNKFLIRLILVWGIFVGCILMLQQEVAALSMTFQGPAYAPIQPVSTLKLSNNGVDFNPGEYAGSLPCVTDASTAGLFPKPGITVQCHSSVTSPWTLSIQANDLTMVGASNITIPRQNFRWAAFYARINKSGGIGSDSSSPEGRILYNNLKQKAYIPFTGGSQTVYISDNSLDSNHTSFGDWTGTQIEVLMDLSIPKYQRAGAYKADLIFTLTQ